MIGERTESLTDGVRSLVPDHRRLVGDVNLTGASKSENLRQGISIRPKMCHRINTVVS